MIEQLKSDEKFQGFLKARPRQRGFTNEDIQFVVGEYIQTAGQGSMTAEKAQAELQAVWKDENAYKGGLQAAYKGIAGAGAESRADHHRRAKRRAPGQRVRGNRPEQQPGIYPGRGRAGP